MERYSAGISLVMIGLLGSTSCSPSVSQQEGCTVTTDANSDDLQAAMVGYARSMNKCYDRAAPEKRKLFHGSSTTEELTIPTNTGGRVVINVQSKNHLSNGQPDPQRVTEVGGVIYGRTRWDRPNLVVKRVMSAFLVGSHNWSLNLQTEYGNEPSVVLTGDQLMVNGKSAHPSVDPSIIRGDLADRLSEVLSTARNGPPPNLGAPVPGIG
jgi:hypothetical protein